MVTFLAMLHVRQAEHRQTDRQYAILRLSLADSQNLCQTMNGLVETALTLNHLLFWREQQMTRRRTISEQQVKQYACISNSMDLDAPPPKKKITGGRPKIKTTLKDTSRPLSQIMHRRTDYCAQHC